MVIRGGKKGGGIDGELGIVILTFYCRKYQIFREVELVV